jgi:hypothetical protein
MVISFCHYGVVSYMERSNGNRACRLRIPEFGPLNNHQRQAIPMKVLQRSFEKLVTDAPAEISKGFLGTRLKKIVQWFIRVDRRATDFRCRRFPLWRWCGGTHFSSETVYCVFEIASILCHLDQHLVRNVRVVWGYINRSGWKDFCNIFLCSLPNVWIRILRARSLDGI